MSVSAWDDWFSLSIRRNRQSFMLAMILLFAVCAAIVATLYFFEVGRKSGIVLIVLFLIPAVMCNYCLTAQRLRDINLTGWLALLWIPIGFLPEPINTALYLAAWIILCVVPGTEGRNRFGADPLASSNLTID